MPDYIAKLQAEETHRLMTSKGYVRVDPAAKKETTVTEQPMTDAAKMSDIINRRAATHARQATDDAAYDARVAAAVAAVPKPHNWHQGSAMDRLAWAREVTRDVKARMPR
ncbi:MAG: hypothetical protein WDN46_12730 [Methylocella sp.]